MCTGFNREEPELTINTEESQDEEPSKAKKRKLVMPIATKNTLVSSFLNFEKNQYCRKEDIKEADSEKEASMEAELRAARERAIVPLEARMTQFKDMLLERGVSTKHVTSLVI